MRIFAHISTGVLVFLASALAMLGSALTIVPDSVRATALYGFLMATAGVGLSVASYHFGRKLGVSKPIGDVLGVVLALCATMGVGSVAVDRFSPPPSLPGGGIWCTLVALEMVATLAWLIKTTKRARAAGAGATVR